MSTLQTTTSSTRPTSTAQAGDTYFETDTGNIIVYDGSLWRGYQNDGINFGSNSYVAELNGTDQYLTLGDVSGTLGGVNKCSVSCWMKQPTITTPTYRRVWQMGDTYDNLALFWNSTYWLIVAGLGTGSYKTVRTSGSSTIDDDTWHLWTVVYDGTQSTDATKLVIYKNTTLQTMAADSGPIPTSLPSTCGDEPHIGALYNTPGQSTPYQFSDASFDDFAIFDDALTSTEISNIYNNQIYPSSLQHMYRLENNVNDSVGSADGTQVNSPITSSPSTPQFPY